ncbi:DUF2489 domain-containing protein [Alteromonas sediminis]|uniref:DUF2489 domain-containing protein n=1 Tax=Alteromonas sediminis TaxID=2259342 RepID=A0A3N5ZB10_9ALTE|nr:DUF2489 domain-containing protein [Alteromonas sediminis]RPJ66788.1 DUF2489 domain-containing protein [Alteromonas sediminis]
MFYTILLLGALIIAALAFYAGRLLFLLKKQNERQAVARQKRVATITESVTTIAMAMSQQQCDLSEGAIRICRLLDALPLDPKPDYDQRFPHIYGLFIKVSGFDTHEARMALDKRERRRQDRAREEIEAEYESRVLGELEKITTFCKGLG